MNDREKILEDVRKEYRAAWVKEMERQKEVHKKEILFVIDAFEKTIIQAASQETGWKKTLIIKASNLRKKYDK